MSDYTRQNLGRNNAYTCLTLAGKSTLTQPAPALAPTPNQSTRTLITPMPIKAASPLKHPSLSHARSPALDHQSSDREPRAPPPARAARTLATAASSP
jgi:hypothetical protein